ncbi:MAG: pilin [Microgenomates group bacterium]
MPPPLTSLEKVFENLISAALAMGGIALFIMFLSGGFKYLTSGGDPKATEGAQKTLTYAITGIVVLAGAFLILKIISTITNVDITKFIIYRP